MVRGVGGTMEYYCTEASFAFAMTDGNLHVVDQKILIAKATQTNTTLPSLLGWDILRDFRLSVQFDSGMIELDPLTPNIIQVPPAP
jgi:hypothetical protein